VARLELHPPARHGGFVGDGIAGAEARAAGVLVAMFDEAGEARLILTKRPDTLPTHQGQIAFPGGKFDAAIDADLAAAALREAHEEIGIDPHDVRILAELDHISTVVSGFVIAPFVGALAQRPAVDPAPGEVTSVFDVALSELLDDSVWREEIWDLPWARSASMPFYDLAGETVWGATARILTNLLAYLTERR